MAAMLHFTSGRVGRRPAGGGDGYGGMLAPSSARDGRARAFMLVPSSGRDSGPPRARMMVPASGRDSKVVHDGFWCDGCSAYPLVGVRRTCARCDLDYCGTCFPRCRHAHPMTICRPGSKGVGTFDADKLAADLLSFMRGTFAERQRIFARKRSGHVQAEAAKLSIVFCAPESKCTARLESARGLWRAPASLTLLFEVNGVRWRCSGSSGIAHACGFVNLTVHFDIGYDAGRAVLQLDRAEASCDEVEVGVRSDDGSEDAERSVADFMRASVWTSTLRYVEGLFQLRKDDVEAAVALPLEYDRRALRK
eukprot:PLAT5543.1.p1 GENE.PLAT5543.1~~PLAT5543.1.p1  ORF type:complete len:319 (-),score=31.03 PLAT5543.1:57-980(-)